MTSTTMERQKPSMSRRVWRRIRRPHKGTSYLESYRTGAFFREFKGHATAWSLSRIPNRREKTHVDARSRQAESEFTQRSSVTDDRRVPGDPERVGSTTVRLRSRQRSAAIRIIARSWIAPRREDDSLNGMAERVYEAVGAVCKEVVNFVPVPGIADIRETLSGRDPVTAVSGHPVHARSVTEWSAQSTKHRSHEANKRDAFEVLAKRIVAHYRARAAAANPARRNPEVIRTYHGVRNQVLDHKSRRRATYKRVVVEATLDDMIEARRLACMQDDDDAS